MVRVKNRLSQPLVINCGKGRVVHLLPGGAAILSEEEVNAPEVQSLLGQHALEKVELERERTAARKKEEERPPLKRKEG